MYMPPPAPSCSNNLPRFIPTLIFIIITITTISFFFFCPFSRAKTAAVLPSGGFSRYDLTC